MVRRTAALLEPERMLPETSRRRTAVVDHARDNGEDRRGLPGGQESPAPARTRLAWLSFAAGWRYLTQHGELVHEAARPAFPAGTRRALVGGLVYVPAIAIAFVSPDVSFAIDALIALYFAVSRSEVPGLINRAALQRG